MKKNMSYMDSVHRDGRIWNFSMATLLLAFPVLVAILFGVTPDWNALIMGLVATAPMYWAVGAIEVFTFVPMLGAGGAYLGFVTGNISNLKLPRRAKSFPPSPSPPPPSSPPSSSSWVWSASSL